MISEALKAYYRQRLGGPSREAEFVQRTGKTIEIWKWEASATGLDVTIYATVGSFCSGVDDARCEFFIGLCPEEDGVVESLAQVAVHGSGRGTVPTYGDTVTLPTYLWPGTRARSFLFNGSVDEIFPSLHQPGSTMTFIQLIPLTPDELSLKSNYGLDRLWEHLKEVAYWDPRRV